MTTLKDEIDEFINWVFNDPKQQFYREAFAQHSSPCLEVANEEFDHYHRLILALQPPACRRTIHWLVDLAKEHCPQAPIPSQGALEALSAINPREALDRPTPVAAG